jgi:hypothetical protein
MVPQGGGAGLCSSTEKTLPSSGNRLLYQLSNLGSSRFSFTIVKRPTLWIRRNCQAKALKLLALGKKIDETMRYVNFASSRVAG